MRYRTPSPRQYPLPPRPTPVGAPATPAEQWPDHYRDAYAERVAVAAEGGAVDPEAVALADLRVMHWRELCAADALAA